MDSLASIYAKARVAHWDARARRSDNWSGAGGFYHRLIERFHQFHILPGLRVLELGCGCGDLLAALKPTCGVGVDFSEEMVRRARERHPALTFIQADVHEFSADGQTFDVIILSDLVNELWDVQVVLERAAAACRPQTRVLLNFHNHLWHLPLVLVRRLGLAFPQMAQNWLTPDDVTALLRLAGFEVVRHFQEILLPLRAPLLAGLANRYLVKLWPFRLAALTHLMIARPLAAGRRTAAPPRVSVVIPARNEAGNIAAAVARIPDMGGGTEIVFVEGNSTDDTYQVIERTLARDPQRPWRLFRQTGKGKGDAVRLGFDRATGDILMILDADLTMPPEELPKFYEALASGKGEFINGVRLVYPMEERAMRFMNLVGNKFFSLAFTWLLGQPVKDTLCGTKVLWRDDYAMIARQRRYFGDFDPFGDFDLLFGAIKLNRKIVDLPIRYRERTYGETNIQRWRHGWLLLRMVAFAARRLKFV